MSELRTVLIRRILATGPLTLADYMAECLFHPSLGYYTGAEVFGAAGDFTTAPEISQVFGEILGLALAQGWIDQGRPETVALAELGPGRGTLIADMLRAATAVAGWRSALRVHLVEASPKLREVQRRALGEAPAKWHHTVQDLPEAPLYLVANEFFDALPIRQFVRDGGAWRERIIVVRDGALSFALSEPVPVAALAHRLADTRDGDVVEHCPALAGIVGEIARRIVTCGGMALIVDYGGWRSLGDTFQALRNHRGTDPLAAPGHADLTAHVDFERIAAAALDAGAAITPLTGQGAFLELLGITARAQALAARIAPGPALENHIAAHRRLTHPQEMGSLFKTLAIYPPDTPQPPGFAR
ncbi:class I SAM-dependent methyltransferase [Tropicimonas sp.]|uniref:class I SAM-dependent methyltransferase n=1 Tax=Tropicimonas sp. TaxID=2067044 RepID=UPI003A8A6BEB